MHVATSGRRDQAGAGREGRALQHRGKHPCDAEERQSCHCDAHRPANSLRSPHRRRIVARRTEYRRHDHKVGQPGQRPEPQTNPEFAGQLPPAGDGQQAEKLGRPVGPFPGDRVAAEQCERQLHDGQAEEPRDEKRAQEVVCPNTSPPTHGVAAAQAPHSRIHGRQGIRHDQQEQGNPHDQLAVPVVFPEQPSHGGTNDRAFHVAPPVL